MKFHCLKAAFAGLMLCALNSSAQQTPPNSNYNNYEAFGPGFYTKNGNEYRSASGQPGPAYWQNRADYKLDAALNEVTNQITGTEQLTYTNNSPDALSYLWLQLDQNIYANNSRSNSVIGTEDSRDGSNRQVFDGGFKIKAVKLAGTAIDLKYIISDSRMQIFLPEELKPKGDKVSIYIEYAFIVPNYGSDRMGIVQTSYGNIYCIGQWYPRMCVYDDVLGWNTLPYLGQGEFYLEYGDFDVNITAPANNAVVCSGALQNATEVYTTAQQKLWAEAAKSDNPIKIRDMGDVRRAQSKEELSKPPLTWHFKVTNARDAAWAASAAFIVDAAKIDLPEGKTAMAISAYPTESDDRQAYARSTEYVKSSIEYYSKTLFPYPYPNAINVAGIVSGMEYPGIVFCGYKERRNDFWETVDHELGHTWFPMIVGSNERLYGWMDEGFNTFINSLSIKEFNKGEYKKPDADIEKVAQSFQYADNETIMSAPDAMRESSMGQLAYFKPSVGLNVLRDQVFGADRFDRAFKTYIAGWAYKHPTPDDFFRTMENVSGENLNWFWRGWFLNNWRLDQSIRSVKYDSSKGGTLITVENLEKMPMPLTVEVKTVDGKKERFSFPVEIWQSKGVYTFLYPHTDELESVTIDPDHVFPDSNTENNTWHK